MTSLISQRFFVPQDISATDSLGKQKKSIEPEVTPLGLGFAKEMQHNPRSNASATSQFTSNPTPRGDTGSDVEVDVDF